MDPVIECLLIMLGVSMFIIICAHTIQECGRCRTEHNSRRLIPSISYPHQYQPQLSPYQTPPLTYEYVTGVGEL